MTFSFLNSDVDRLSLDQRVSKLEKRGGSGGGGNFSGNLPDFDQFPDNAMKLTNEGLVLKFSVDNVGTTFNCPYLPGVEFKSCAFLPYYSGILCSPFFLFARVRFKNNVNDFTSQGTQGYSAQIPFDYSDYKDNLMYTNSSLGSLFGFGLDGGGLSANNLNIVSFAPMLLQGSLISMTSPNLSCSMSIYKPNLSRQAMSPCYSFGAAVMYDFQNVVIMGPMARVHGGNYGLRMSVGGYNCGQNISVKDLNTLPAHIRNIYPASWTTP